MDDNASGQKRRKRTVTLHSVEETPKPVANSEVRVKATQGKGVKGEVVITTSVYYKAWAYYKVKQTARHVKESLEREGIVVGESTCSVLVHKGYPQRGLQPLSARFESYIKYIDSKVDYNDLDFRKSIIDTGKIAFAQIKERFAQYTDAEYQQLSPLQLTRMMSELSKCMDSIGFRNGASLNNNEDVFKRWTPEQKKHYLQTGQWPDDMDKTVNG